MPRQHLHQPRRGDGAGLLGDGKALVPQVAGQALGGALGAGQHGDGVALFGQRGQVVIGQAGHLAAPGGQRVGGGVDDLLELDVRHAAGKILGAQRGEAGRLGQRPARRGVKVVQPGAEDAVLQQALELLVPAELVGALGLPQ